MGQHQLLLCFVSFHTSAREVEQLQGCLHHLPDHIGYAVVVNDYRPPEPIERLREKAVVFLTNNDNCGYGRAINRLARKLEERCGALPDYLGILNTDLTWRNGTFEQLLDWMAKHQDVSLAVPQILDRHGEVQRLCKQNPTILGLFSRRFIPESLKPTWLKRYDAWYEMADQDYWSIFDVPYLSGCCMIAKSKHFKAIDGFDEHFFLYLEDADLTRSMGKKGRSVHLPIAEIQHNWGRGNHRSLRLTMVNIHSAWVYFTKWGWKLS
jgi:GT2 family glycosyltransferase